MDHVEQPRGGRQRLAPAERWGELAARGANNVDHNGL